MCFGGGPSIPQATPPPAAQLTAREQDATVTASLDAERRRRAAAKGYASTLITGGAGITAPASSVGKTLLGQ